ncbi:hypothetical protein LF1_03060 [Rubripirellula obstinata]|uniref:Transmembrane protein n=1 Tax=Rubripirellula obstinata TaxID=406547 RepID=A0A5B1CB82_9BACT|nr:hypothetical protein [Rubripirellula obstinata]KAA1257816.1 hypothetical protein LF1_03060 [Rubripirellula obstinata]
MLPLLKTIEPFALLLALLPLVGYLLVLGFVRFSGRALVTTGARDLAALGIAVVGLIAIGPAELFFPATAATVFGSIVWLALIAFYGLTLALVCLTATPKLVVYGRTAQETFPGLLNAAKRMDAQATGDLETMQIQLPTLNVQLRIDTIGGVDHCRVLSFQPNGSMKFWNTLLGNLRGELSESPRPATRRGVGMLVSALLMGTILCWYSLGNQDRLADGFRQWFWR